ncbi:SHOCT domain-containing protein [Planococcus beigongshangi]|uniref:SHOCT domain-containing protein n=1 Tax=Planococcus beigongshangi TaxID=2782536 RepID=UPI00193C0B6E|nr:SHOCT domain-containing protein [Planococcus beigongshangi]
MDIILLSAFPFPIPLRLLIGLLILLAGVLTLYWFFMAKNNPKSQKIDELPANNDAHKLQDQYDRGEITEDEYHQKLRGLDERSKPGK